MRKKLLIVLGLLSIGVFVFIYFNKKAKVYVHVITSTFIDPDYVNKEGNTIKERVVVPDGYTRVAYPAGSFQAFIQQYPLKAAGTKVINYDGSKYYYQSGHIGVLALSVPKNGLQQCADALIRLRAEYLWKTHQKEKIGFEFTSGHYCSWIQYAAGFRPKVKGNKVSFHRTAKADASKASFYRYLNLIYTYSGTLSLFNELPKITKTDNLQIGDMLVRPGTPGHIVMIVDEIKDAFGNKRFVLAQGNTPAQSVHMLKNLSDTQMSPWYELPQQAFIEIPGYYFEKSKFVRFKD
jgi:hypothetical protein